MKQFQEIYSNLASLNLELNEYKNRNALTQTNYLFSVPCLIFRNNMMFVCGTKNNSNE